MDKRHKLNLTKFDMTTTIVKNIVYLKDKIIKLIVDTTIEFSNLIPSLK